ncbi:hypothetical protein C7S17_6390 [Burkholderia thailandensis]|nr:hypothetical protein [Burkholderia thailandensis]
MSPFWAAAGNAGASDARQSDGRLRARRSGFMRSAVPAPKRSPGYRAPKVTARARARHRAADFYIDNCNNMAASGG